MVNSRKSNKDLKNPKPLVLCILDGWGDSDVAEENAIFQGTTPTWDRLKKAYPYAKLDASDIAVGLPAGQMGNSEVGHMHLGAGRIVVQDLLRIDKSIATGSIQQKKSLQDLIAVLKNSGGTCHLMGLLSPGGVHSHQNHILALIKILDAEGISVCLHAFLDGRDTPPSSAKQFVQIALSETDELKNFRFGTISGRYYAMDRDNNWDRVEKAYRAIAEGRGEKAPDALTAINKNYATNVTDEFILPTVLGDYLGIKDGDGIFMSNFRADRVREILTSIVDPLFNRFDRAKRIRFSGCAGFSEYSSELNQYFISLFPQKKMEGILGKIVSDAGLTQLRIAETEKYAHVTFFFNGGAERKYPGESRILIPSPKVATFDLKPEMSSREITDELVKSIEKKEYDFVVVNYANGDMVGHTGIMEAAIKATEAIDKCLNRLESALLKVGGTMLVTADHGNVEKMLDAESGEPHTAHTLSQVPVILVNPPPSVASIKSGTLADVAPTLVKILGLTQPSEMTGRSLILENKIE